MSPANLTGIWVGLLFVQNNTIYTKMSPYTKCFCSVTFIKFCGISLKHYCDHISKKIPAGLTGIWVGLSLVQNNICKTGPEISNNENFKKCFYPILHMKNQFFIWAFTRIQRFFCATCFFIKKSAKLVVLQAITELSTSNLFQINFPSTNTKMLMFSGFNWIL